MSSAPETWLSPAQHRKRAFALLAALLLMAVVASLLAFTWWRPWQAERARGHAAAERLARMEAVIARQSAVHSALLAAESRAQMHPLVLPETDRSLAQVNLMQRFTAEVAAVGEHGTRCQVDSQGPPAVAIADPMRVAISAHLRCGNSEWLSLAEALESSQPVIAIESVSVVSPTDTPLGSRSPGRGVLDINVMYSAVIVEVQQARAGP